MMLKGHGFRPREQRPFPKQRETITPAPPLHRLQHRDLIRVLDVAADGNPHYNARHLHARALELMRQISSGRFAFNRGIGSDHHLIHAARIDAAA